MITTEFADRSRSIWYSSAFVFGAEEFFSVGSEFEIEFVDAAPKSSMMEIVPAVRTISPFTPGSAPRRVAVGPHGKHRVRAEVRLDVSSIAKREGAASRGGGHMQTAYTIDVQHETAGVAVGRPGDFKFFSSVPAFDSLDGQIFRSLAQIDRVAHELVAARDAHGRGRRI
jgi:hypothetical protein